MFESNDKTKLSPSVKKMVDASGGQEMSSPSYSKSAYHQGSRDNPTTFWYQTNSPDMRVGK